MQFNPVGSYGFSLSDTELCHRLRKPEFRWIDKQCVATSLKEKISGAALTVTQSHTQWGSYYTARNHWTNEECFNMGDI